MALCSLIPRGHRVADVGTDHARLPAYLVQRGITTRVIATDIRPGPLARADRTICTHSLGNNIELRLGDGLTCVSPDEVDSIVIAGMGADTIIAILEASPWSRQKNLILQPMTHKERLLEFMGGAEPVIVFAKEGRREYCVMNYGSDC